MKNEWTKKLEKHEAAELTRLEKIIVLHLIEATQNYVWDILWRFKACNLRKNAKERALFAEYERLMKHIKELAESEA